MIKSPTVLQLFIYKPYFFVKMMIQPPMHLEKTKIVDNDSWM